MGTLSNHISPVVTLERNIYMKKGNVDYKNDYINYLLS